MRSALFVDGISFYLMQKECLGFKIDPKRLFDWLDQNHDIVDATYYSSTIPENDNLQSYLKALSYMGYRVENKNILPEANNSILVELVTDMFVQQEMYDEIILVSGDVNLLYALNVLKNRGKKITIVSTNKFTTPEMRSLAGLNYYDLYNFKKEIEKVSNAY